MAVMDLGHLVDVSKHEHDKGDEVELDDGLVQRAIRAMERSTA